MLHHLNNTNNIGANRLSPYQNTSSLLWETPINHTSLPPLDTNILFHQSELDYFGLPMVRNIHMRIHLTYTVTGNICILYSCYRPNGKQKSLVFIWDLRRHIR
jgi:hypothetical protein